MKIRKLLVIALTATLLCGTVNVNAYAAEIATADTVTDVESTEESANEDTEAGEDNSLTEEGSEATTETVETEETTEETSEGTEEAVVSEAEVSAKESEAKESSSKEKTTKKTKKYTKAELKLMSALIFCEAGSEPYAGKLAVGIVVMNRVESDKFPNTLKNVVYQKYQFGPARNGALSKALDSYENGKFTAANHKESIKAAKAALKGTKNVTFKGKKINMKNMLYFSGRVSGAKLTIGNHQFK